MARGTDRDAGATDCGLAPGGDAPFRVSGRRWGNCLLNKGRRDGLVRSLERYTCKWWRHNWTERKLLLVASGSVCTSWSSRSGYADSALPQVGKMVGQAYERKRVSIAVYRTAIDADDRRSRSFSGQLYPVGGSLPAVGSGCKVDAQRPQVLD